MSVLAIVPSTLLRLMGSIPKRLISALALSAMASAVPDRPSAPSMEPFKCSLSNPVSPSTLISTPRKEENSAAVSTVTVSSPAPPLTLTEPFLSTVPDEDPITLSTALTSAPTSVCPTGVTDCMPPEAVILSAPSPPDTVTLVAPRSTCALPYTLGAPDGSVASAPVLTLSPVELTTSTVTVSSPLPASTVRVPFACDVTAAIA